MHYHCVITKKKTPYLSRPWVVRVWQRSQTSLYTTQSVLYAIERFTNWNTAIRFATSKQPTQGDAHVR